MSLLKFAVFSILFFPALQACAPSTEDPSMDDASIDAGITNQLPAIHQPKVGVIFETNFSEDSGYYATNEPLHNINNVPKGWDAVKVSGNGAIEVVTDLVVANYPVLKVTWDPNLAQPTSRLLKHLTKDINTGYDELYIRYNVRLPTNFKAGDGAKLDYWKWGRLWQNTAPTNPGVGQPGAWTENRADSFYTVWNFSSGPPYTSIRATWGANTGANLSSGSAGGERYKVDYYAPGATPEFQDAYFEQVGGSAWDFNTPTDSISDAGFLKNRNQTWHTLEFHFKLASSAGSNDGIFEVWIDGIKQSSSNNGQGWTRIEEKGGAVPLTGIPTARMGSGYNMFVLFDNMSNWNSDWANPNVDGFIYVKDIVVSTRPIGAVYQAGTI